ncbi:MAG: hypothetical protein QM755_23900 [Luteolibacter sp.]
MASAAGSAAVILAVLRCVTARDIRDLLNLSRQLAERKARGMAITADALELDPDSTEEIHLGTLSKDAFTSNAKWSRNSHGEWTLFVSRHAVTRSAILDLLERLRLPGWMLLSDGEEKLQVVTEIEALLEIGLPIPHAYLADACNRERRQGQPNSPGEAKKKSEPESHDAAEQGNKSDAFFGTLNPAVKESGETHEDMISDPATPFKAQHPTPTTR